MSAPLLSLADREILLHRLEAGGCIADVLADSFGVGLLDAETLVANVAAGVRVGRLPSFGPALHVAVIADCVDGSTWLSSQAAFPDQRDAWTGSLRRRQASLLRKLRAWGLPPDVEFPL